MILAIDTTKDLYKIAICRGENCTIKEAAYVKGEPDVILPTLDELLKSINVTPRDIRGIAVHHGPGSFTGLRNGVTTANTLAWILDVPILGFAGENYEQAAAEVREALRIYPHFKKPVIPVYPEKN